MKVRNIIFLDSFKEWRRVSRHKIGKVTTYKLLSKLNFLKEIIKALNLEVFGDTKKRTGKWRTE